MKSSFEDPQISKDFIIVNQLFPPSFNLGRVSCNILSSSPVSLKLYNFHMVPRYLFGHETCNTINQISTLGKDHFECDGRIICRPTKELVSILLVDRDYYWRAIAPRTPPRRGTLTLIITGRSAPSSVDLLWRIAKNQFRSFSFLPTPNRLIGITQEQQWEERY